MYFLGKVYKRKHRHSLLSNSDAPKQGHEHFLTWISIERKNYSQKMCNSVKILKSKIFNIFFIFNLKTKFLADFLAIACWAASTNHRNFTFLALETKLIWKKDFKISNECNIWIISNDFITKITCISHLKSKLIGLSVLVNDTQFC